MQVGLHAWGRAGKAATPSGFTTTYLEDYVGNQPIAQAQVLSFVSEGVFERFPELRVVVAECGFAWLPPLLWRFDKDWKGVWREVPWVKRRPSEYVREHFLFTTAPAHLPADPIALGQLLEMMDGSGCFSTRLTTRTTTATACRCCSNGSLRSSGVVSCGRPRPSCTGTTSSPGSLSAGPAPP